jgi:hypothetical protein
MQTLTRPPKPVSSFQPTRPRRRRFSPLMLISVAVTLLIALGAGIYLVVLPKLGTHAAATVNMDCALIVPPHPLTAQGLATPYQLTAFNPANGPCNEANPNQGGFVQAAILNLDTGQISIYNPLVIDKGTQPAIAPVVPQLPQNRVVGIWFGSNANTMHLFGTQGSLQDGNCVTGFNGSIFGQVSFCNAAAFFTAANNAIRKGQLTIPPLGTGKDGLACPTVRDFSIVDMDQSDNVTTEYLVNANGQTAQLTAANAGQMQGATVLKNGSDNRLLSVAVDGALGCTPFMAPDLADNGAMTPAQPLDELQAAAHQANPVALVPLGDDMTVINGNPSLGKTNAYRAGVDQPPAATPADASTKTYCQNLLNIAPQRLQLDSQFTQAAPSIDPAMANNLFTFLAQRFVATYGPNGLNCVGLLKTPDPVSVQTDANGVAISATIANINGGVNNGPGNNGNGNAQAPNCTINGTTLTGCAGTVTINGQSCLFSFANGAVDVTCPAPANNGGGQQGGNPPNNHNGG